MGQRNILCTNQMLDLEMDQQNHGYPLPEPGIVLGTITGFPQPDMPRMVPASQNMANPDSHHFTDCYASPMFYQMPHYGVGHHHPAANGVAMASNFYIPSLNNSPVIPLHHGSSDQLPSASNYGVLGVPMDEYGRNNHFMDNIRASYKRKTAERIPGNFQHINASASSSSSLAPLNTRHPEGVAAMDAASFVHPQFRGNGIQPIREVGSHRSVRNRSGATGLDPVLAHNHNHYMQGNYVGQPFQPSSSPWLDQRLTNNCGDLGASRWNQPPFMTYMQGSNASGGSLETGRMGLPHYHDTAINGSSGSTGFLQSSPADLMQNNFHHLSPSPVQPLRGQNVSFHPQVAAARVPQNYASHSSMNLPQDDIENSFRHPAPVPPTGIRIYQPHREGSVPETSSRRHNLPYLRFLPTEGVAMLELSDIYEIGSYTDHHRDMRLDIEDMSYEELLELGEQIGNVSTGLSEEIIMHNLKTRTYISSTSVNLEETACVDQEPDSCIICQDDYKRQEKIGTLDCGHEYHAVCLKKWLLVKNVCPICKSEALVTEGQNV
ncbi:probable E3 ubiquitin-protein ligase ZFP1 [Tripterygium wilfordii]|uniref:probable E3 ubiquitin-protein ligase ZFP1 n=1 Tax=Tripterygium wilfordii TaxID=458696 RepID=UPI0018F84DE7|nr:probable E3 ubiquitin-protein ligase ZFP1 [Tripterygium wilfordii]XP_038691203.1 probable E3 ubiquitin-protein ligase ZFP1 [Tripterygium wilfordii]XP_038691204.1 probable E3 ubiquitin-protein ligase ZFP1 [Tripterygium wilfordii]